MAKYKLSNVAREDLIRIHQYGVERFGMDQDDRYLDQLFEYFELISERPRAFEVVGFIRENYRRCVCGSDSIFYRIKPNEVEIMTIIGRQDTNQILE